MVTEFHLAQVNTPRLRYPLESPEMADFVAEINQVNEAADKSEGFIWRQTHPSETEAHIIFDDPEQIVNLSVWESAEDLLAYMRSSLHVAVMRRRQEWFHNQPERRTLALWWIPVGHTPDIPEAEDRLIYLGEHGPTEYAFDFRTVKNFPNPSGSKQERLV